LVKVAEEAKIAACESLEKAKHEAVVFHKEMINARIEWCREMGE